jgi:drug/metabolite transporter (DMT)-like permease
MSWRIPSTRAAGVTLAFATAAVSGIAVFTNGYAVKHFKDATVYTTAKNAIAAVVLLALVAVTARSRRGPTFRARVRRSGPGLLAIGVIGGSIPFVLFFEGLARAQSVQAAFIQKTLVIWVVLLALPLLEERITFMHVGAIALLVGGQAALTHDIGGLRFGSGELMILGATLLWAIETVIAKRVLATETPLVSGSARMGIGLVVLLGWLAVGGRLGVFNTYTAEQWKWVLLTGGILSVYVATWYAALARAQAVDVTAMLVFGAVITAVLAGRFRGAPLGPDAFGLGLVTLGAAAAAAAALRSRRRALVRG